MIVPLKYSLHTVVPEFQCANIGRYNSRKNFKQILIIHSASCQQIKYLIHTYIGICTIKANFYYESL